MLLSSGNEDELPYQRIRHSNDELDPLDIFFMISYPDGEEEGNEDQPSFDTMSRITRDRRNPITPDKTLKVIKIRDILWGYSL